MPRILTVDDSRAVRMIVAKHVKEIGFEVEEAEDGEQGLLKLEVEKYDLVVLDVTMPNMDGPTMLGKMRERGDETPVLMLTSESKRTIVAGALKLGICEYILKPFKANELQSKIFKALKINGTPVAPADAMVGGAGAIEEAPVSAGAGAGAAAAPRSGPATDPSKQFSDLLVIDDMENVSKRLRTLVPEHLSITPALTAQLALGMCRDRVFRVILVDNEMPNVNTASLLKQLRLLQPHAGVLMLALRTTNNVQAEAQEMGFDGVMYKPFTPEGIEDFLLRYFDNQELVSKDNNVVRVAPFKGRENRLPGYFTQIGSLAGKSVDDIAAACFAEIILDLSQVPPTPDKTARLVLELGERAKRMGLELRLVGPGDVAKALQQYAETATLRIFNTIAEAQSAGAS